MNLSERLKKVRESLGKSQKEIAKLLGISFRAWQGYELGKNIPGSAVIVELAKIGFNANWILTGKGEMKNEVADELTEDEERAVKALYDKAFYKDLDFDIVSLCLSVITAYKNNLQEPITSGKEGRLWYTLQMILSEQKEEWRTEEKAKQILEALLKISDDFDIFRKLNMDHRSTHAFLAFLENPDSLNVRKHEIGKEDGKKGIHESIHD